MTKLSGKTLTLSLIPISLAFIFIYPRILIANLGKANPWTSFFYLYGFGGAVFLIGLLLILKTDACNLTRPRDRQWFFALTFGFIFFLSLHAIWIYLSLSIPYKGV